MVAISALASVAGYGGFWLARWLDAHGAEVHVVQPSSVPVDRRKRRAKSDKIDADLLLRTLLAWLRGEPRVCSMLGVPDETPGREAGLIQRLAGLRGIGAQSATSLVYEAFIRPFASGKAPGSYAGLTGAPLNSGGSEREQGVSKSGNRRLRGAMHWLAKRLIALWRCVTHGVVPEGAVFCRPHRRRKKSLTQPNVEGITQTTTLIR